MTWPRLRTTDADTEILSATALRFLAILAAITASVLIARLGGPEAKGVASTFAAVATMSFAVTSLGVPEQVVELTSSVVSGSRRLLLRAWLVYTLAAAAISLVVAPFDVPAALVVLGCLCYLVPTQAGLVTLGFAGVRVQAFGALLQPIGLTLLVLLLSLDGSLHGWEAALATALSYLLPLTVYWKMSPSGPPPLPPMSAREIFRHGSKWQLPQIAQRIVQRSDILIVYTIFGPAQAGVYSVASQLSELCFTIPRQVAGQTYNHVIKGTPVSLRRSSTVAGIASLVSCVGVGALGLVAVTGVYGEAFSEARMLLLFLLPGPVIGSVALVFANFYRARRIFRPSIAAAGTGAVTALCLSIFLAMKLGPEGVALGSSIGWAVYSIVSICALRAYIRRANTSESSEA